MSNKRALDTGTAVTPTARTATMPGGMPASNDLLDYGTATNTAARPDTSNPPTGLTNPPSATPDLGDQ